MLRVKEAIVVEGRYDKAALRSCVDAVVVDTAGFGVFSDGEKLTLLRYLAKKRGLIILTDSDGGGLVIRSFLKTAIDPALVKHAYIPEVFGRERRKAVPSREGKLGVEGMSPEILVQALRRAGATVDDAPAAVPAAISKADLYAAGLTGRPESAALRDALLRALGLPAGLTPNALLAVLRMSIDRDELFALARRAKNDSNM